MKDWRKYMAEMIGTGALVLMGCGVAVFAGGMSGGIVAVSLAFGLIVMAMIYAIGSISGAHLNPAVSLGFALRKKMSWMEFVAYVVSQLIGAIVGAAILYAIVRLMGMPAAGNMGANTYSGLGSILFGLTAWKQIVIAMIVEVILTFIFYSQFLALHAKYKTKQLPVSLSV